MFQESFYKQCSLRIISCPSCMINLRFKDVDLPCTDNNSSETDLVCNSICIFEPPYSTRSLKCVNGTAKNSSIHYKSLTSQVNLNFINGHPYHNHAFTAEYLITSEYIVYLLLFNQKWFGYYCNNSLLLLPNKHLFKRIYLSNV